MSGADALDMGRPLPQDVHAEQAVLGAMLLDKKVCTELLADVDVSDFYAPKHQDIYTAIEKLRTSDTPADALTVAAQLTKDGVFNRIGGAPYLHTLINTVPTAANGGYYADIVKERATLRRMAELGTHLVQMAHSTDGTDIPAIIEVAGREWDIVRASAVSGATGPTAAVPTLADFLADDGDGYEWVVPGLLERGDRLIITAPRAAENPPCSGNSPCSSPQASTPSAVRRLRRCGCCCWTWRTAPARPAAPSATLSP